MADIVIRVIKHCYIHYCCCIPTIRISQFNTSKRYKSQIGSVSSKGNDTHYVAQTELDSHADTIVAGRNCIALSFSDRSCDVAPYSSQYEPIRNVPIATAATGYTSADGRDYILIFHEALWMPSLDHSLINPNQLRAYDVMVQDNPYSEQPMQITNPDGEFTACLVSKGTTIYMDTWTPSDQDLSTLPHIVS